MGEFIQVYEKALDADLCRDIIRRFESSKHRAPGLTGHGLDTEKKRSTDITITNFNSWRDLVAKILAATFPKIQAYMARFPHLLMGAVSPTVVDPENGKPVVVDSSNFEQAGLPHLPELVRYIYRCGFINVQKYHRGEGGYPHWHSEMYPQDEHAEALHRVLLWMFYLNDVEDGGETEFFYQKVKIPPRTGSMVIAPAGFTHTHRGNIPVSNDKYILTSWVMFNRAEQLYKRQSG